MKNLDPVAGIDTTFSSEGTKLPRPDLRSGAPSRQCIAAEKPQHDAHR